MNVGQARRLFFALWPDDAARSKLAAVVRGVIRADAGTAVALDNLHATLAYLGPVPESRLPELTSIAQRVAQAAQVGPVQTTFDRIEYWTRPRILCATAAAADPPQRPADSFNRLADALKQEAISAGFTPDLEPQRAHATVMRNVRHAEPSLGIEAFTWNFTEFVLVESQPSAMGSRYSVIGIWQLKQPRVA